MQRVGQACDAWCMRLPAASTVTNRQVQNGETDLPDPISPYGAAKLAAEYYCRSFTATYGFETVALRYFNVFGPRQDPDSPYSAVIPLFITAILENRQPVIFGNGHQSRDFTYIANVVHGNLTGCGCRRGCGSQL